MQENTDTIFSEVDSYISSLLASEDQVLQSIIQIIDANNWPQQSVSSNQGKFLQVLMKACNAKRVLEIGTYCGYSTIWMARALPPGGKMITLEFDSQYAKVAEQKLNEAGLNDLVKVKQGKALETLGSLAEENEQPFDFIFIDADKPPYKEYFDFAVKLSRSGSIIVCDNVIRAGKVLDDNSNDEKVIGVKRLNESLKNDSRVTATIVQNVGSKEHDGMVIAVVK
ncbi:MAG: O-methyltransferase [Bacteroidia bacterium]